MNEKEFRKLKRSELIELIYELEVDLEKLQQENEQLKQQLDQKTTEIRNLVSLEQAIERLNGICEVADPSSGEETVKEEIVREETVREETVREKTVQEKAIGEMVNPSKSRSGEEDRLDEMLNQRASRIDVAIQRMEEEHKAEWQKIKDEQLKK
ncbi:MAG: hypothetical protein II250_02970 [Agathobacter sp.]|nr:hypothetical protein [Agathobacter sp.]